MRTINLFYAEPDPDRWLPFDRYPRRLVRRLVRGRQKPGGVMMIALGLMKGLDLLNIPYRFNDYGYARAHPTELVGLIGKPQALFEEKLKNPLIFGSGVYSHPVDEPALFQKYPNVQRFLVPGEWMRQMCIPFYRDKVIAWPVGIDTTEWAETDKKQASIDFLVYDKIRWDYDEYEQSLLQPIKKKLPQKGLSFRYIRYGSYKHETLKQDLEKCRAAIFLCEHETQGQAYQQMLATNTPVLAWDRGGYWQDPAYYPHKVKFGPVSSVPYWDDRCGLKFTGAEDFGLQLDRFLRMQNEHRFEPRQYILDNLTLEKCALKYVQLYNQVAEELA